MPGGKKILLIAIAFALVALCGLGVMLNRETPQPTYVATPAMSELTTDAAKKQEPIMVYVSGEVYFSDTYQFPQGSRWVDAIQMAGGLKPTADRRAINLAQVLQDGEHVDVPKVGERDVTSKKQTVPLTKEGLPRVAINRASKEELMLLPGVGEKTAQQIITLRSKKPFRTLEDLRQLAGFGDAKLKKLEPCLIF